MTGQASSRSHIGIPGYTYPPVLLALFPHVGRSVCRYCLQASSCPAFPAPRPHPTPWCSCSARTASPGPLSYDTPGCDRFVQPTRYRFGGGALLRRLGPDTGNLGRGTQLKAVCLPCLPCPSPSCEAWTYANTPTQHTLFVRRDGHGTPSPPSSRPHRQWQRTVDRPGTVDNIERGLDTVEARRMHRNFHQCGTSITVMAARTPHA